ncbi:hypothetical protein BJY01DRAFT_226961 [Aspergillus pseudoustus]|uniref:Uncharacterized protein n=1 Tax=Aspergillus pseudoustus TaxID=1810923 RepID=A0ABR4ISK6_9EURO
MVSQGNSFASLQTVSLSAAQIPRKRTPDLGGLASVLVLRKSGTHWWGTRRLMIQSLSNKMGPFDKLTLFPVTVSNIGYYQASDISKFLPNVADKECLFRKREQMLMFRIRVWKYSVCGR